MQIILLLLLAFQRWQEAQGHSGDKVTALHSHVAWILCMCAPFVWEQCVYASTARLIVCGV